MLLPEEREYEVTIRIEHPACGSWRPHVTAIYHSGRHFRTSVIALEDKEFQSKEEAVDYGMEQARETLEKADPQADIRFHVTEAD